MEESCFSVQCDPLDLLVYYSCTQLFVFCYQSQKASFMHVLKAKPCFPGLQSLYPQSGLGIRLYTFIHNCTSFPGPHCISKSVNFPMTVDWASNLILGCTVIHALTLNCMCTEHHNNLQEVSRITGTKVIRFTSMTCNVQTCWMNTTDWHGI